MLHIFRNFKICLNIREISGNHYGFILLKIKVTVKK